ncbi:MAG: hypothetical protein ACE1ZC_01310, partial [Nitrososphaerales archaeon]
MRIFDEIARTPISILTEGNNVRYLELACQLRDIDDVDIVSGLEGVTGKDQLKTLFDFFSRAEHKNKVLFVFDCDVKQQFQERNSTFAYVFPENPDNKITKRGIENAFQES